MEELRPDVLDDVEPTEFSDKVDQNVVAPGETLDDRQEDDRDFEVNETIARAGTGYDPTDPAVGDL